MSLQCGRREDPASNWLLTTIDGIPNDVAGHAVISGNDVATPRVEALTRREAGESAGP